MEKEKLLKQLESIKQQKMKLFKEKAASPLDIIKKTAKLSAEQERIEQRLKEL
jgi:putative cell wall-binding protein